jgi:hypothetical protein
MVVEKETQTQSKFARAHPSSVNNVTNRLKVTTAICLSFQGTGVCILNAVNILKILTNRGL